MKIYGLTKRIKDSLHSLKQRYQIAFDDFPVFDAEFYIVRHPELKLSSKQQAKRHWVKKGIKEGRISSPVFSAVYYLENNKDIRDEYGSNYQKAVYHWLLHGIEEGRIASPLFNYQTYIEDNPQLITKYKSNVSVLRKWMSEEYKVREVEEKYKMYNIGNDTNSYSIMQLNLGKKTNNDIPISIASLPKFDKQKLTIIQTLYEKNSFELKQNFVKNEKFQLSSIKLVDSREIVIEIEGKFLKEYLLTVSLNGQNLVGQNWFINEQNLVGVLSIPLILDKKFIFIHDVLFFKLEITDSLNKVSLCKEISISNFAVGRLDKVSNDRLYGWAYSPKEDDVYVSLYVDDVLYKSEKVNRERHDLKNLGLEKHHTGFSIHIPSSIEATKFSVKLNNSDFEIKGKKQLVSEVLNILNRDNDKASQWKNIYHNLLPKPVKIIVPIYNAYDDVLKCLSSLTKYTASFASVLLINDASSDENIKPLLDQYEKFAFISVIHNSKNLGYTKTINKAITRVFDQQKCDIILLNSDTIVTEGWLKNLRNAAYSTQEVGTVTARSNNAGAFSLPNIGTNIVPNHLSIDEVNLALRQMPLSQAIFAPTGNGFCLYIKEEVFKKIGLFDEKNFPIGYGEENDFCMRAIEAGYSNMVCDAVYIFHKRSASFKDSKKRLMEDGRRKVDELHPSYSVRVSKFTNSELYDHIIFSTKRKLNKYFNLDKRVLRKRILFVISTLTGGTPKTNMDLMEAVADYYEPLLLHCNSKKVRLFTGDSQQRLLESHKLEQGILLQDVDSVEYEKIVSSILYKYGIDLLHIRHIGWHSISLPKLAATLDIPVVFSFHDFYTICPNVNLLDSNLNYCGGLCTDSIDECSKGIWKSHEYIPPLKHQFVHIWQKRMKNMFNYIDVCITTSESARKTLYDIYPELIDKQFEIIPHGRNFRHLEDSVNALGRKPLMSEKVKILVAGNITSSKGLEKIVALKEQDKQNLLEFHFLGTVKSSDSKLGVFHGKYNREDFYEKVQKINPAFSIIFSIWPETFCHTLTESWSCGIPVITFGLGAIEERIKRFGGGWIISKDELAVEMYKQVLDIVYSDDYLQKVNEILYWQQNYMRINSTKRMGWKYREVYGNILLSKYHPNGKTNKVISVGIITNKNATSFIRIREWFSQYQIMEKFVPIYLSIEDVLSELVDNSQLDLLVLQRNAIPNFAVKEVIDKLQETKTPYLYEIDDDLLAVPSDKDTDEKYLNYRSNIKLLLSNASVVTTTNLHLKEKFSEFNKVIHVIPNYLDQKLWFSPIERRIDIDIDSSYSVLYMGNFSHKEDLYLIFDALRKIKNNDIDIKLYIIGGFREEISNDLADIVEKIPIPKHNKQYYNFVKWFVSISHNFDIAIAPLQQTDFNTKKSFLKFLQYSAVKLPVLASDIHPYNNIIKHETNGILVENNIDAWYSALKDVITAIPKKENDVLVDNAYKLVTNKYLKKDNTNKFEEALISCL